MLTTNKLQGLGAMMLGISIALGAFGAHSLEKVLSPHYLDVWEKACLYFSFNALGLMVLGNSNNNIGSNAFPAPIKLIFSGSILFSVSLWVVSLNEQIHPSITKLAIITPLGGLAMIVGWIWLSVRLFKSK